MFDLILFFLTFLDQQVFVIIISYRLGGLFGIFGRYNDSRESNPTIGGEGMGVICPLFRRRCHQKSPSRGSILKNSC